MDFLGFKLIKTFLKVAKVCSFLLSVKMRHERWPLDFNDKGIVYANRRPIGKSAKVLSIGTGVGLVPLGTVLPIGLPVPRAEKIEKKN